MDFFTTDFFVLYTAISMIILFVITFVVFIKYIRLKYQIKKMPITAYTDLFDSSHSAPHKTFASKVDDNKLQSLADMAVAENWEHPDKSEKYNLLRNYLQFTFLRLQTENKIYYSVHNDTAMMNTGLELRQYGTPIYAFFKKSNNHIFWELSKFSSNKRSNDFPDDVEKASYPFIAYNDKLDLDFNIKHIVKDNRNRFPQYLQDINDQVLISAIKGVIAHKKNISKEVGLCFYNDNISYLIPLFINKDMQKPDLILVAIKERNKYRAITILPFVEAYKNARLLGKPSQAWLTLE
jgi:hypothetical protein